MEMLVKKEENTLRVYFSGEIDHHEAVDVRLRLDMLISEERPQKLVFDFSNVTFMDSSGIGLVLGRYRIMNSFGGKTFIHGASMPIKKIFIMSGISKYLEVN